MKNAMPGVARACLVMVSGLVLGAAAAPDLLPSEVKGVIGSGDQLSLQLRGDAGAERTIKVGEEYRDGWTLQALSPTKATLAKDGAIREIGLNPQGVLASAAPAGAPSSVSIAGVPDDEAVRAIIVASAPTPQLGLSLLNIPTKRGLTDVESRRFDAYGLLVQRDQQGRRDAAAAAGLPFKGGPVTPEDFLRVLGQAGYDDEKQLQAKVIAGIQNAAMADLAARPVTGPTSYYVPAGVSDGSVATAQGIDRRGVWEPGPVDAQGGQTYTLTAGTAEQDQALLASGRRAPDPRLPPLPRAQTASTVPPPPPSPPAP